MKTNSPAVGTVAWKRLGGMTVDEANRKAEELAEERTRIGNTPTCETCGEALDHCTCDETEESQ